MIFFWTDDSYNDRYEDAPRYTVNGIECYRSRCERNNRDREGFWSCDTDDNGAWDYCCRPRNTCGKSKGHFSELPWLV